MKVLLLAVLALLALACAPALRASSVSSCSADGLSCNIFEDGQLFSLPFLAISGDVVITEPWDSSLVSDVFRIFNDFFDSGGGTGLGETAFLYSLDLGNLPDPSTYSVNAVFISEGPSIGGGLSQTDYASPSATVYSIFSSDAVPEPSTFALVATGAGLWGFWRRRRLG